MNAETIDLLKKVQGRRGEWRSLDPVYSLNAKERGFVFSILQDGGVDVRFEGGWACDFYADDPDLLWLPPPTPRWPGDDEKRTLVGMIDGTIEIYRTGLGKWGVNTWKKLKPKAKYYDEEMLFSGYTDTLPEALLRAVVGGK